MKTLLVIMLCYCWGYLLFAQEVGGLPVRNYHPKEYDAHVQNWAVEEDLQGVIHFGNSDGLLSYDGVQWTLTEVRGKASLRKLTRHPDGTIYVGGSGTFGYLTVDSLGRLRYVDLFVQLDSIHQVALRDVNQVYLHQDQVFFRFGQRVCVYSHLTKQLQKVYYSPKIFPRLVFSTASEVFVFEKDRGLLKVGKEGIEIPDSAQVSPNKNFLAINVIDWTSNLKLIIGNNGLMKFNSRKGLSPFPTALDSTFFKQYTITSAVALSANEILVTTSGAGCVVLNQAGEVVRTINSQTTGLLSDQVYGAFIDSKKNLWLAFNKGLAKVDIYSPLQYWNETNGLIGTVESAVRHQGVVYVATHSGGFYLDSLQAKRLGGTPLFEQCWMVNSHRLPQGTDVLWLGASGGLYEVKNKQAHLVKAQPALPKVTFFDITQSKKNPNKFFCATNVGVLVLHWKNNEWHNEGFIKGTNENNRSIVEDEVGDVWVGTFRGGVIRISGLHKDSAIVKKYKEEQGFQSLKNIIVFQVNNHLSFGTEFGLMKYDAYHDKFIPDNTLGRAYTNQHKEIFNLIQDQEQKVWLSGLMTKNTPISLLLPQGKEDYTSYESLFNKIPQMMVLAFYVEKDNQTVWAGGSEGLYRYKYHEKYQTIRHQIPIVRQITLTNDSLFYGGNLPTLLKNKKITINYRQNDIKIQLALLDFTDETANQYSYYLEGFEDKWSEWSTKSEKEYTNLYEGTYTFHFKARNIDKHESGENHFTFTILPPWYRTWWAYFIYVSLGLGVIGGSVKWYNYQLVQKYLKIKQLVEEQTSEIRIKNEELITINEEIQQQAEEITIQRDNLDSAYQNIHLLSAIGKDITSNLDITNIVEMVYSHLNQLLVADVFLIGVYNTNTNAIEVLGCIEKGEKTPTVEYSLEEDNRPAVWCFTKNCELVIDNFEEDYPKYFPQHPIPTVKVGQQAVSLIYLPLTVKDKLIGVLSVQSFRKDSYGEYQLNILRNIAVYTAIALSNAEALYKVEKQKKEIDRQHEEVKSSINAALRIQEAMLPSSQQIGHYLEHFFILYRPRDIVSGDFYWFAEVARSQRTASYHQIMIVADCTGHGVPGAFMSMVGYNLLNEIVKTRQTYSPDLILTELNEGIKNALQQTEKGGREGMDMAVVGIEKYGEQFTLYYAGAMNPLYYIQNKQFYEIKGDKLPIGGEDYKNIAKSFTLHTIDIVKTNEEPFTLYLCTDGYQDQFGGEKGKKFMTKQLKETLFQMYYLDMSKQYQTLNDTFDAWKGNREQIDDVTIIGIKL